MKSAGNDIVALRTVNKQRTGQFRFYSKILSVSEQVLYHQPGPAIIPFVNYVWLLWSVKESVYKYLKRSIPDLLFSPTSIGIQNIEIPTASWKNVSGSCIQWEDSGNREEFYRGKVIYGSHIFYFRSKISEDWIATVVNDDEHFNNVCWGIQSTDDASSFHQSKAVRTLLLNKLHAFFPGDLQVKKSPVGYPVIVKGKQEQPIPVSLSHDDLFVAYSFAINSLQKNC
jgi:phosphopantetheinyl transferase (holo-ACP synthase)